MSRSKRIYVISNMYPNKEDKFYGIFVKNFLGNFEDSNVEVTALSTINGRGENSLSKIKKYFQFYISIFKNVLKFNYDLIYVHYPGHASLPLLMLSPIINKPVMLNFHGSDVFSKTKLSALFNLSLKPLIRKSASVVVPSLYFKKIVAHQFKISADKIFISPSGGIDTDRFRPLHKDCSNNFTLGYVGRIDEGKGWDVFLKAISRLQYKIPNLKCIIAGNGKQSKEMKNMVEELGLSRIISIKGAMPHHKLPFLFNQFDLFVFPTIRKAESLGLVGVEALSCGVPIIGSRIGGLQDYINDGKNGLFFNPGDSEELATTILSLYSNKEQLQRMSENARASIKIYDRQSVGNHLEKKILQLVN